MTWRFPNANLSKTKESVKICHTFKTKQTKASCLEAHLQLRREDIYGLYPVTLKTNKVTRPHNIILGRPAMCFIKLFHLKSLKKGSHWDYAQVCFSKNYLGEVVAREEGFNGNLETQQCLREFDLGDIFIWLCYHKKASTKITICSM